MLEIPSSQGGTQLYLVSLQHRRVNDMNGASLGEF